MAISGDLTQQGARYDGLVWSPNGSRLLVGSDGALFTLNPDALPKVK